MDAIACDGNGTGTNFARNARAYDQDATNGATGDGIGDSQLFVNDVTGRPSYTPYYDAANVLLGTAGDETIDGGAGNDTIVSGAGKDALTGGAGNDVFRFTAASDSGVGTSRDVIGDFEEGDTIDLSAVGATSFIGGALFGGGAGEVRTLSLADQTIVEVDTNGDRLADMQIEVAGAFLFDRLDFVGLNGVGTEGADTLYGSAGAETIRSLGGNDVLFGRGDEVRFTKTNTVTFVEVDFDGDTVADMQIEFNAP